MLFKITHTTDYKYSDPVAEAYLELRLTPPVNERQTIFDHEIAIDPVTRVSGYHDYFGNRVDFISLPFRHSRLVIENEAVVETHPVPLPERALELTVQESRQILSSALPFVFDYLQPTEMVKIGREATQWARRFFSGRQILREALEELNHAIHQEFKYSKGATEFSTDLSTVWRARRGVCQDFAHVMLSVLRTAGVPSRYVCGYLQTALPGDADSSGLVGSLATHAWVEILVPGQIWIALDPTNNRWCGEQHVAVSLGRDADDAAPIRGTFKGSGRQSMKVKVKVAQLKRVKRNRK
jgi:transglutaminase-like putative cysteine protease